MTAFVVANMAPLMFSALVVFLLLGYPVAFALAANGIVFGLVNSLILNPFSYPDASRLISISGSFPSQGAEATASVRPRFVAECSQPWGPPKSTSFRAARAGLSRCLASSSISSHPESVIGARERSR